MRVQSSLRVLARGLVRHCPRCGEGGVFEHWFRMRSACRRCGLVFEREEGFFLGAFVLNFAVTEIALGIMLAVSIAATLPDAPVGLLIALAAAVTVLVPLAFYPTSKTLWASIDLLMNPR